MKKIIAIAIALLLIGTCVQAAPLSLWEYGTLLASPATMDGGPSGNPYYLYRNYFKTELSSEEAHAGELSFKVYPWVYLNEGVGDAQEIFVQNLYPPQDVHKTNRIVYESFLKGADVNGVLHSSFVIEAKLYREEGEEKVAAGTYSAQTEPAENGWLRAYTVIPPGLDYDYILFSVGYFGSHDTNREVGEFYIDDIAAWLTPVKMQISDVTAEGEVLDLHKLIITGIDSKNERKQIRAKDNIEFRVVSGDARIAEDGRTLISEGSGIRRVVCEAELFGITATFTVTFRPQLTIGTVSEQDNVHSVTVSNHGSKAETVYLVTCIYDGEHKDFEGMIHNDTPQLVTGCSTIREVYID